MPREGCTTLFQGTLAGGRGERRKHPTHSIAMAGAVTSPNYFLAPGFISDPGINSDRCIYPHLSHILHRDTDNANVGDIAAKDHCRVKVAAPKGEGSRQFLLQNEKGKLPPKCRHTTS